jgi:hypothetical protein
LTKAKGSRCLASIAYAERIQQVCELTHIVKSSFKRSLGVL